MTVIEHRTQILAAAQWGVSHTSQIHYTEDGRRGDYLKAPKHELPMWTDCSGFVTWCFWVAGAPDPSGLGYAYVGDTETLAKHGKGITLAQAHGGDLCILGLDGPLSGQHVVMIADISNPTNPLVISHGSEAGPLIERLNNDTRSKRFFQYVTTTGTP